MNRPDGSKEARCLGEAATSDGDGWPCQWQWRWQFSFACDELSPRVQMQFGNSEEREEKGRVERSISKATGCLALTGLKYLFDTCISGEERK